MTNVFGHKHRNRTACGGTDISVIITDGVVVRTGDTKRNWFMNITNIRCKGKGVASIWLANSNSSSLNVGLRSGNAAEVFCYPTHYIGKQIGDPDPNKRGEQWREQALCGGNRDCGRTTVRGPIQRPYRSRNILGEWAIWSTPLRPIFIMDCAAKVMPGGHSGLLIRRQGVRFLHSLPI